MRALLSLTLLLGLAVNANVSAQTQNPTKKQAKKQTSKETPKAKEKEEKKEDIPATQSASTTAPVEVKKDVPAAPASPHKFTANVYAEYYAEPRAEDPNATVQSNYYGKQRGLFIPTAAYTYNKEWALSLAPEFRYNNGHQNGNYPTSPGRVEYARALIALMRKGILNEKDHGVGFEAGVVRRIFNKSVVYNYGNYRLRTIFTKTFNDKFNAKLFNEVLYTAKPKNKRTSADWLIIDNIRPTVNWQITEKLSFMAEYDINVTKQEKAHVANQRHINWTSENYNVLTYQINDAYSVGTTFKYNYNVLKDGNAINQNLEISPNVAYTWSPGNMVQFELAFDYNEAHDNKSGLAPRRNFHQYPNFVLYFMQTLF